MTSNIEIPLRQTIARSTFESPQGSSSSLVKESRLHVHFSNKNVIQFGPGPVVANVDTQSSSKMAVWRYLTPSIDEFCGLLWWRSYRKKCRKNEWYYGWLVGHERTCAKLISRPTKATIRPRLAAFTAHPAPIATPHPLSINQTPRLEMTTFL